MSSISMVESKLPPGFRFHPRDEELVCDYLMRKLTHSDSTFMVDVDLNKCEPWDIPATACVGGKEWYFYTQRDRKYASGLRTNRATACGYWKATGKDRHILNNGIMVGMRKTLVFYQGRAPKGRKTEWVMHEFRGYGSKKAHTKEDWVLCRVFYKSREAVPANPASFSNLPSLMESYISFDPPRNSDEQVPCFSIFSQNQTSSTNSMAPDFFPIKQARSPLEVLPSLGNSYSYPSISGDSKVIEAVLNQLTKMDSNSMESPSLGEGCSESYLTEVGMPNLWNHYSS